jgi:DNA helicase-2/ATP-dependent DNA helicase PcrA
MTSPILASLNPSQLEAVTAPDGPVLVLAGPGSGKTRVLTHRVAWLIQERGFQPWQVMAVTFTNKAAREMRSRVERLLGGSLQGLNLGTFHAVCARILRREADSYLPFTRDYVIYDTDDQLALIKSVIIDDLRLDTKTYQAERILRRISQAKNDLVPPDQFLPASYRDEMVKRAYERYQQRLIANNALDFDDLLMWTVLLFDQHPGVLARYRRFYEHILVDEFQDTNGAQYALVRQLAGGHRHIFCVGDEDQSIYRWRGADYRNLLRLRADFPELRVILLEQNYRSTQIILDAATAVIDRNQNRTPKALFTERKGGVKISLYEAYDEKSEANFVVETIAALVAGGQVQPGGCAVMYRTNAQSRALEEAFIRAGLPYRLVGATRFYGRREVKDVLAYLRIIHNPDDSVSLSRVINVPPRGIGDKTLTVLSSWAGQQGLSLYGALCRLDEETGSLMQGRAMAALLRFRRMLDGWRQVRDQMPPADLLKLVLDETGYQDFINDGTEEGEDRWANVLELLNVAAEYGQLSLADFLGEVSLVSEVDNLPEEVSAPSLLTLHAAKGLEFDAVFITGLEEGILPHDRSKDDPEALAEERRLMYVGMTRAKQYLFLIHAFRRMGWGGSEVGLRSRFIDDIPPHLLTVGGAGGVSSVYHRVTTWASKVPWGSGPQYAPDQGTVLKVGQRVLHPKFGEGIVVECRSSGDDQEVSVQFEGAGLRRLLASFANLTVLED